MYDEKELVNFILQKCGESTTATLETSHPSVLDARNRLADADKDFQSRGWWFNKEQSIKLLPDTEGRVQVPAETLSFVVTQCSLMQLPARDRTRFVKRGNYIYDTISHTNQLNVAVWADIVIRLDYSDLPAQAATYLKWYAAEQAFLADDGDASVYRLIQQETAKQWALLFAEQLKATTPNVLNTQTAYALKSSRIGSSRDPRIIGGTFT